MVCIIHWGTSAFPLLLMNWKANAWGAATSLAVVQSHMPGASSSIPCLDILSPRPAPDPLLYTLLTVDAGRRRDALYIPSAAIRLLPLRLAVSEGAMKC